MRRNGLVGLVTLLITGGVCGVAASIAHDPQSPARVSAASGASAGTATTADAANAANAAASTAKPANPFANRLLTDWLAHRHCNITAAVYDVRTKSWYLYRPHVREKTASIVKVDILATALHQAQTQHRGLTEEEQELAVPMIEVSDNDAALDLYNAIGGASTIMPFDLTIGMTNTTVNPNGYFGLTLTTAADQIKLLQQVMLPGGVLTLASREYEYELMRHVTADQRWGITGGVPSSAAVAIKNGWLPETAGWHVNSIGSVRGSGRNYLIAVLTEHGPTWDYGIDTIQRIAAAAWKAMGT